MNRMKFTFWPLQLCLQYHHFWQVHPKLYANVLGGENNTAQTEPVLTWQHIHNILVLSNISLKTPTLTLISRGNSCYYDLHNDLSSLLSFFLLKMIIFL